MSITLSVDDISAIWVTCKLAGISTFILLVVGTPIAYWLTFSPSRFKPAVAALIALPLILPPTVLGFYMLMVMGEGGWLGELNAWLGGERLPFTFQGLVIASVFYSLPFVIQPLHVSFMQVNHTFVEVAQTLGASAWDRFFSVILPLAKHGYVTGFVLGFAHTVGEFGVILMIGGSIPQETQVISVQIYQYVEMLNYQAAHTLSLLMMLFSWLILLILYLSVPKIQRTGGSYAERLG
jgi:molybdate transport system permease protein